MTAVESQIHTPLAPAARLCKWVSIPTLLPLISLLLSILLLLDSPTTGPLSPATLSAALHRYGPIVAMGNTAEAEDNWYSTNILKSPFGFNSSHAWVKAKCTGYFELAPASITPDHIKIDSRSRVVSLTLSRPTQSTRYDYCVLDQHVVEAKLRWDKYELLAGATAGAKRKAKDKVDTIELKDFSLNDTKDQVEKIVRAVCADHYLIVLNSVHITFE